MSAQYLVDTDWVIHYLNDHAMIKRRLTSLAEEKALALSIVSLAELYEGVFYSTDPEGNEQKLAGYSGRSVAASVRRSSA